MNEFGIIGLAILLVTFLVSYRGFKDPTFLDRYSFTVKDIRYGHQYYRLVTSGFLHVGWWHLGFNALTLYSFSSGLEALMGYGNFLLIYGASLVGGNLLALLLHRHDSNYSAVGASGAISGIIFATIALDPSVPLSIPFTGIWLPGWLWGMIYVVLSAYGITVRRDNIGHEAHLGGGLVGLLTVLGLYPVLLRANYLGILAILGPALAFFYLLWRKPDALLVRSLFRSPTYQTVDDRYNSQLRQQEEELDRLLDKISRQGIESLSTREKKKLEELSR
ncbi:MAG: rhomboid family intramembrane serine protease [Janthinobacterium lividum]